jgi:hypothetical protein
MGRRVRAKTRKSTCAHAHLLTHPTRCARGRLTHVGRKQALPSPLPRWLKPSARWDVATIKAPDMGGQLGDAAADGGGGGFAYDLGKFHISLPRLQATLEL